MKVVAVTPLYPPHSLVGSWISTHECLAHLAAHGHQVDVVPYMARRRPVEELDGVTIHPRSSSLSSMLSGADLVVSHLGDNGLAARLAPTVPHVKMAHSHHSVAGRPSLIVACSQNLADRLRWSGSTVVVRPPVRPEQYRTTPGDHVTLVNLSSDKGGRLLWRLADALPDVRFLAVRGAYGSQIVMSRPNVEVIDPTSDMRTVYARTRVLLMPSIRETWGRVAVEAAVSGIPTIAHPTDGAREALGRAATYADRSNLAAWVAAIRRLEDPAAWAEASARASARAAQLDPAEDLERFRTALETSCLTAS